MSRFSDFGNDLYTGRRSIDFVGRRKLFYLISAVVLLLTIAGMAVRGGVNLGIEFTGGSDFRVPGVTDMQDFEERATTVVRDVGKVDHASVTRVGSDGIRVQTERFDDRRAIDVRDALGKTFGVPAQNVTSSVIGPSWGQSVTRDAVRALIMFFILVSLVLAVYFRTWKMALAALVALAHDILFTVGIYALAGFEVTPASAIGFLTILGYSMYDTVVVFDKVRENTQEAFRRGHLTYGEACNLAVNQTLVRSINTSVVALLPVAAILIPAWVVIGPGTLRDLSLALFIGIAVGTYSSIFIATPLLVDLRSKEKSVVALQDRVTNHRTATGHGMQDALGHTARSSELFEHHALDAGAGGGATAVAVAPAMVEGEGQDITATGRPLHPYAARAQVDEAKRAQRFKRRGEK